jgi:hypothetical protein
MEDRTKVMTLLLAMVVGEEGKLLRVSVLRLGVRVMEAKLTLLTDTPKNWPGSTMTIVSW